MNNKDKFKNYKQVKEDIFKPLLPYIVISAVISLVVLYLTWPVVGNPILLFAVLLFGVFLVHLYRPRLCPGCGRKMKRFNNRGIYTENHYCEKCRQLISTGIKNEDWPV